MFGWTQSFKGEGGVAKDKKRGRVFLKAAKLGLVEAKGELAHLLMESSPPEAFNFAQEAAKLGKYGKNYFKNYFKNKKRYC